MAIHQQNYISSYSLSTLLKCANAFLMVSVIGFIIAIMASYPLAPYLSLPVQISAHIATIILAALVKISYVLRCIFQYSLGMEVR